MDVRPREMYQTAPYPEILAELIAKAKYRPNWRLTLDDIDRGQGSKGLTFIVRTLGYDTYDIAAGEHYGVLHYFPVPPAAFNAESWKRWMLDCLIAVETHEACEFLVIDGTRPFAPHHGPGWDPYIVLHHGSDVDARTDFRGDVQATGV